MSILSFLPFASRSRKKIREGEAPAEPLGGKLLIQNGSTGASPFHANANWDSAFQSLTW
jgi:hypothetical protein